MNFPFLLFVCLSLLLACSSNAKGSQKTIWQYADSILSTCPPNIADTFNIEKLQTDDFSEMIPINENLFGIIYPKREDFSPNTFFIYACIPHNQDYKSLVVYQKNYEGEGYRVDYIDLVNIDTKGKQLDRVRLAAKDTAVITYEVESHFLGKDSLWVDTYRSIFDAGPDTLFHDRVLLKLNGERRIDTLESKHAYRVL